MILYFIRHGDPIYAPDSLTELGKRQAEAVAKRLAMHGIDEIYSSTSNRAKMTAQPLSEIIKKPINELDWCNECYAWEEFTVTNEQNKTNWMFWDKAVRNKFRSKEILLLGNKWYEDTFFDKKVEKGVKRINAEIDGFLSQFGFIHNRENAIYEVRRNCDKRIVLFAHQGFSMMFFSSLLDIPYPLFSTHFDITHTGVSTIYFPDNLGEEVIPKILSFSNDSHIYKEDLPTKFCNGFYI